MNPRNYPPPPRRPADRRNFPTPARRAKRPRGPERTAPKRPRSGKHRRRQLKAAAWRLARLARMTSRDAIAVALLTPEHFVEGDAWRLAQKIIRLHSLAASWRPARQGENRP